jgi:hypothetical protein
VDKGDCKIQQNAIQQQMTTRVGGTKKLKEHCSSFTPGLGFSMCPKAEGVFIIVVDSRAKSDSPSPVPLH